MALAVIGAISGIVTTISTNSQAGPIAVYILSTLAVLTLEVYFFFVVLSFYNSLRYQGIGTTEGVAYKRSP